MRPPVFALRMPLHLLPENLQQRLQFGPADRRLATDQARERRIGNNAAPEHHILDAARFDTAPVIVDRPYLAVRDDRNRDRITNAADPLPMRRRVERTLDFGACMDDQSAAPPVPDGPGAVERQILVRNRAASWRSAAYRAGSPHAQPRRGLRFSGSRNRIAPPP